MAPIIKSSVSGFDATTYPSPSSSPVATRRMAKAALRTAPAPAAVDTDVAASRRKRVLTEAAEWSDDEGDQEVRLHAVKRIARELSTARNMLCGRGDDGFLAFVSTMQLPEGVSASTTAPVLETVDLSALSDFLTAAPTSGTSTPSIVSGTASSSGASGEGNDFWSTLFTMQLETCV